MAQRDNKSEKTTRRDDSTTRRDNSTRGRVHSMNWRDEKRTLGHDYTAGRDEHFVQELTPYGGQYLQTQQTVLETHQYIPGSQQTQHGIIETQQKFMETEHRVTAEYPAILKLYSHNSGYVASSCPSSWLGGHRAE